jgi:hypothetical protein
MKTRFSLRAYISNRSGFVAASTLMFGTIAAVLGTLLFDELGPRRVFIVAPAAYLAGYIWGEMMWMMMFKDLFDRYRAHHDETRSD